MNVVLLAIQDSSCVGAQYAKSLRAVGVNATMFIKRKHPFDYPGQGTMFQNFSEIESYVQEADVIHLMHSQNVIPGIPLKGKKVVVSHTGTSYRIKPESLNKTFNPIVDLTIVGGDLSVNGAKNAVWTAGGVCNMDNLSAPSFNKKGNKLIVGHYPSSKKKGTTDVINAMTIVDQNKVDFRCEIKTVPWNEQMKRLRGCDVYIERLAQNSGFGIAALEAAAVGCIVVTTYAFKELYEKNVGKLGLISVNKQKEMSLKIDELANMSDSELLELKKKNYDWVMTNHSYEAVGNRLVNMYNGIKK